jgi:hypothetical protein
MVVLKGINTGIPELDKTLKIKYSSLVNRCRGKATDKYGHYNGLQYMDVFQWKNLCNNNKDMLAKMWRNYISNNKNLKYAISIDRIDEKEGYVVGNVQFRINGFNSWKRNLTPIKVDQNGVVSYFMSSEEASRHYGVRRQAIGEILNKIAYHQSDYAVELSSYAEVLKNNGVNNLEEYYYKFIDRSD